MSTASTHSSGGNRRLNSLQNEARHSHSRSLSNSRKRLLNSTDAYSYALRVAYLAHLLQPRARRTQKTPGQNNHVRRSSSSFQDLLGDFVRLRDSKSTRFPHGFISELEKRLTGILVGKERRKEYQDREVVRTFAIFLNALKEQSFKRRMEQDRRVEDLVLIFFSNATKELGKGKESSDDSWSLMVDRHVALFVRLITLILKEQDWAKDRPELTSRLAVLESKLLAHDQDLADGNGPSTTTEIIAPISYDVKDMPLVQFVSRIFGTSTFQAQDEINRNKGVWTEKAALQDLKNYQAHLTLKTGKTLSRDDFPDDEAYEAWKRGEGPDLSQMMLAIVQSNPELAKSTPGSALPQFNALAQDASGNDSNFAELSQTSSRSNRISYVIDQPIDLSSLSLTDGADPNSIYTFIPSDPRSLYRAILSRALMYDIHDQKLEATEATSEVPSMKLLSKQSTELLNEICLHWRIPASSRVVLFLDVIREKFMEQKIDIETVDSAFTFVKEAPAQDGKKRNNFVTSVVFDRSRWIVPDSVLMRELLWALREALLRELYEVMMHCYDPQPHPIGPVMYVLDHHVRSDPHFEETPHKFEGFAKYVSEGLHDKAKQCYQRLLDESIPADQAEWEAYQVTQLGDSIMKLGKKIQKRYRNNPEIMGVNPLDILLSCVLPMYAKDAQDIVIRLMQRAKDQGIEIPVEDGFELYKGFAAIRRLHRDALPGSPFPVPIEDLLSTFVWQWVRQVDDKIMEWVEQAAAKDAYTVRSGETSNLPEDELRHSVSAIDIFRSFNQVVEELVNLGWDDDYQYAKFMTALSKSIGRGIAKYCELLEQSFIKEMDRLSPDQEASLVQSRQEKLMQLAKEAWNYKEKIEPFQFLTESLVKLNNIEYAIAQLDKLEKEINVDGCADAIAKHSPPMTQQKVRKATTYVFTVKIVEGEDLKACDIDGWSDPYVVLTDEYQKRIAKTHIVYRNLNPRWDSSIDITTKGPLNIIATVWDWDAVGDHDYVGRTSLKLDPAHFSDFLPREFWLDLDTQGRILLRVSMEGERDDIQFYFGKCFRTLKRTEKEMTRKITEKLSAYISHSLSRRALKALLNRGLTISSFLTRSRSGNTSTMPSQAEIELALDPLFTYFNDNFAIMDKTLTSEAMKMVMARLWKEVLVTIEGLLVPPLSDKPSHQRPLTQQEVDIVSKWLELLLVFFQVPDEVTGEANGVSLDILKSPKYHEIQSLNFFYFEPTDTLIRTSERMASATAARQQSNKGRLPAATGSGHLGGSGMLGVPMKRAKSVMFVRNIGTMRKAKAEKWREAQADPNDDMILRILRMRPEAAGYLRDRSRQKERLAAAAAADAIVKQSLMASSGGRMTGTIGRR
ncbi:C2 domain protein [Talaromyces proteolyticus]|uniref:C2 domain protein n=1 Tax=Talaromyces proteolyticus TaxID=1131652 RepID=A0AAD4KIK7_9EURO|nr:C2 domain protein [Talaromyces proteolyticus]KAH8692430.1 C2 domain protein [Talaromyces proteolyticus]